jgi:hypothetical protein
MDATQDVILGVLGTQWERTRPGGLESYIESIKRSGFTGRKVMLNWDIHPTTRVALSNAGFELVDLPSPREAFFHARMRVCWEYLRDRHQEFRYIFWLDVKDLVLQSNPSTWMEQNIGDAKLIASTECVVIQCEETNKLWAQSILGEEKYQELKNEEVINGGTWAGTSEVMAEVFHQVHLGCSTYTGGHPPCQIWINYVMRQTPFKEVLRIPRWSDSFAACLHPMWSPWRVPCSPFLKDAPPVFDPNTGLLHPGTGHNAGNNSIEFNPVWGQSRPLRLIPASTGPLQGIECVPSPGNKPFCIVHGYDRDWDMKEIFEYKYRNSGFNLSQYKAQQHVPEQPRRLRRPHVENIASNSHVSQASRIFQRN